MNRAPGPGQSRSADPAPAGRWRRLLAFVIDALILIVATGALWGRLLASFASRMSNVVNAYPRDLSPAAHAAYGRVYAMTAGPFLIVLAATILVAVSYYWLLTGCHGATIGKRSLRIGVVSAGDGTRISLRASLLRALVFVVGAELTWLFFIIDNLWLTRDQRRQCLHDKAARTVVVAAGAARGDRTPAREPAAAPAVTRAPASPSGEPDATPALR